MFRIFGAILGVGGKMPGMERLNVVVEYLFNFFYYSKFFFVFVVFGLIVYLIIKSYKAYLKSKLKNVLVLLHRLQNESSLLADLNEFEKDKQLEIKLSIEETISQIKVAICEKIIIKRIGKHFCDRMLEGLDLIKENKIEIEMQVHFINNWIELLRSLLLC